MSIPTSLIVVLLVVAWLVVLVPMIAKRRDRIAQSQPSGAGFRVLRRASATLRRRPRRGLKADATSNAGEASDISNERQEALVTVGAGAEREPRDAAEEWAAMQQSTKPASFVRPAEFPDDSDAGDNDEPARPTEEWRDDATGGGYPAEVAPERERVADEVDEQEWTDHAAAAPMRSEVDDVRLRPVPRRAGRGGYDPEAAEATRAYRYQQRRRVTLVLVIATVVFGVAAAVLFRWLWVGAAVSVILLAGYLTYLRRQVRIEASIRQRRMERLQRARQIRPEADGSQRPARVRRPAAAPDRRIVDLDDDDPSFDHIDPYEPPVTYRRAAGQ